MDQEKASAMRYCRRPCPWRAKDGICLVACNRRVCVVGVASALSHRIVFYLTNLHIKSRTTFFVRAGTATEEDFKADAPLSEEGKAYAVKMSETLLKHREQERQAILAEGGVDIPLRPLTVWTSTRLRTIQTADYLKEKGFKIRQRSQMSQINPGVCERLSERVIRRLYPDYPLWRDFPYEYEHGKLAIDVINGGPLLRVWVDGAPATPHDLDALATADEQAWRDERAPHLRY